MGPCATGPRPHCQEGRSACGSFHVRGNFGPPPTPFCLTTVQSKHFPQVQSLKGASDTNLFPISSRSGIDLSRTCVGRGAMYELNLPFGVCNTQFWTKNPLNRRLAKQKLLLYQHVTNFMNVGNDCQPPQNTANGLVPILSPAVRC